MAEMRDLNYYRDLCHEANKKWWVDTSKPCPILVNGTEEERLAAAYNGCSQCHDTGYLYKDQPTYEKLILCVSELSEALEGFRKSLPDDKLPHRPMVQVELVDFLIRCFDLAGGKGWDLAPLLPRMQKEMLDPEDPAGERIILVTPPPYNPYQGSDLDDIAAHILTVTSPIFTEELMAITGHIADCNRHRYNSDSQARCLGDAVRQTLTLMRDIRHIPGSGTIQQVFDEKMAYNAARQDHKIENRAKEGGKRF